MNDNANKRNRDCCRGWCDPACPLKQCVGGDVLFVEQSKQGIGCPNTLYFGYGVICTCSTRRILHV